LGVSQLAAQEPPQGQQGGRQGRPGNFDPAQRQQRMMERYKESLEVTSDDEWKLIQERIQKVTEARREVGMGGMGMGGMMRPRGQQGDNAAAPSGQGQSGRRGFGGEPSQAVQELNQAIEAKAPADQLKAKLAKVRDERKQKQAALVKAQEDLKQVLNVRREAIAVSMGLLE
jgi:hypothetical protein